MFNEKRAKKHRLAIFARLNLRPSPPVLDGAQQLAHGLVLPPALEVFEEDVGVEKYFHGLL